MTTEAHPTPALVEAEWKPTAQQPYRNEAEHEAINARLDSLGGYQAVFNAIADAVERRPVGIGISPMTFAACINLSASPPPAETVAPVAWLLRYDDTFVPDAMFLSEEAATEWVFWKTDKPEIVPVYDKSPTPAEIGATVEEIARLIDDWNLDSSSTEGLAAYIASRLSTRAGREVVELIEAAKDGLLHIEADIEAREFELNDGPHNVMEDDLLVIYRQRRDRLRAALSAAGGA